MHRFNKKYLIAVNKTMNVQQWKVKENQVVLNALNFLNISFIFGSTGLD